MCGFVNSGTVVYTVVDEKVVDGNCGATVFSD